jgi:hypothetical protein
LIFHRDKHGAPFLEGCPAESATFLLTVGIAVHHGSFRAHH